jgi:hypothetical protein
MEKRVPPSMRTRRALSELIEGRLASPDGRAELVKLATRLIVEEALEAECRDALGRDYYERALGLQRGCIDADRLIRAPRSGLNGSSPSRGVAAIDEARAMIEIDQHPRHPQNGTSPASDWRCIEA